MFLVGVLSSKHSIPWEKEKAVPLENNNKIRQTARPENTLYFILILIKKKIGNCSVSVSV